MICKQSKDDPTLSNTQAAHRRQRRHDPQYNEYMPVMPVRRHRPDRQAGEEYHCNVQLNTDAVAGEQNFSPCTPNVGSCCFGDNDRQCQPLSTPHEWCRQVDRESGEYVPAIQIFLQVRVGASSNLIVRLILVVIPRVAIKPLACRRYQCHHVVYRGQNNIFSV